MVWRVFFNHAYLNALGLLFLSFLIGVATYDRLTEVQSPKKWHRWSPSIIGSWLKDKPGVVVAELPYDRKGQFLSAIEAYDVQRTNPIKRDTSLQSKLTAYRWIDSVGRLDLNSPPPTHQQLAGSRIDYVFYDSGRCERLSKPCRVSLQHLTSILENH